jgi:hypothetical protein
MKLWECMLILLASVVIVVIATMPFTLFVLIVCLGICLDIALKKVKLAIAGFWLKQEQRMLLRVLYKVAYYNLPSREVMVDGQSCEYYPYSLYDPSRRIDSGLMIREIIDESPQDIRKIRQGIITALRMGTGLSPWSAKELIKSLSNMCREKGVKNWRINLVAQQ